MEVREAFKKIFGDMYLSESEVALRIFEYGYKAGAAAENEACAKVCDDLEPKFLGDDVLATECAAAIRERMK